MSDYPKVVRKVNLSGRQIRKTCVVCKEHTNMGIEVQHDWFRGGDSVVKVCKSCQFGLTDSGLLDLI